MEAWVSVQGHTSNCCDLIVGQRDAEGWALRYDQRDRGAEIEFIVHNPAWIGDGDDFGIPVPEKGEWHHLAGVLTGDRLLMYIDGELGDEIAFAGTIVSDGTETEIGGALDGYFNGLIDEVRIWNVARTQEEIQATMNTSLRGDEPGLVGYWNFDDGTARDLTASGNHGTLQGDAGILPLVPPWTLRVGDVSGDHTISALDASLILQYVVGLIDKFPADVLSTPGAEPRRNYTVRLPQLNARAGKQVSVPIVVEGMSGMLAGGITMQYDPTKFRAVGFSATEALSGSYWKANVDTPGEVRFAFASFESVTQDGALLEVALEVLPDTLGETIPLLLDQVQFSDSLSIRRLHGTITVIPSQTALLPNYPNPFNPETWIPYQLAEDAEVTLRIYDVAGRLVREMRLGMQEPGVYVSREKAIYWDGRNDVGEPAASGMYVYQLITPGFQQARRLVIVK